MSECVVRMEMPKSCWDCPCLDDYGDYPMCEITNEQRGYNFPIHEKRMPNCPIICQLPEGHGRLVDADKLKEWLIDQIDYYKRFDGPNCSIMVSAYEAVCQVINDFATIVPAEVERSEHERTD